MRISIDMDGVLARFDAGFAEVANRIWPGKIPPDYQPHDWNYGDVMTAAEFDIVWGRIKQTENFWLKLWPYSDNVCSLARFLTREKGHDVWLTTARVETAGCTVAKQTELWLQSYGLREGYNYMGVVVADSHLKVGVYEAMEIMASIDDKGETVEECDVRLKGHRAFLLDRPWNQEADVKRRVHSVEEFLNAL